MCGKDSGLVNAVIEQVEIKVCSGCARFGTVRESNELPQFRSRKAEHKEPGLKIVSNYASLLRQSRERQGLTQEDFAKLLQERESIVAKWEQGRMQPSVEIARKLEKLLSISLIEEDIELSVVNKKSSASDGFTLGDFIKVRKK
mgnify:CR=1 FL=1